MKKKTSNLQREKVLKEKVNAGLQFNARDPLFFQNYMKPMAKITAICEQINRDGMAKICEAQQKLSELIEMKGKNQIIMLPFMCALGNIELGQDVFINTNSYFFDLAKVTLGKNVIVGPNCSFYTTTHPLQAKARNQGMSTAKQIFIKDNVWLCGSVMVCPGVTIGENSVIGTGSVVTKDIPANVFAGGNPCKIVKEIEN